MQPLIILGLPRSGTTWVGEVFSTSSRSRYIFEPDNEKLSPLGWFCKADLHRFPYLTVDDYSDSYHALWRTALYGSKFNWMMNSLLGLILKKNAFDVEAFTGGKCDLLYIDKDMHRVGGGRRKEYGVGGHSLMSFMTRSYILAKHLPAAQEQGIVKSVHAALSAEWISACFPARIVFVLRNPHSLYASYKRLKMPDGFRNLLSQETLQRDILKYMPGGQMAFMPGREDAIAFQIALMYKIIEKQISMHPEWMLISHDRLCMTPSEGYRSAFGSLGLHWSKITDERIHSLNETGGGFTPKRIASQQPSKWKSEMDASERAAVQRWIDYFELQDFLKTHITLD